MTRLSHRNVRQPTFARSQSSSRTDQNRAVLIAYGIGRTAASRPGHGTSRRTAAASTYRTVAATTVGWAPSAVATDAMPPSRSARTSWTAPNACDAMPQSTNATSTGHVVLVVSDAPTSTRA